MNRTICDESNLMYLTLTLGEVKDLIKILHEIVPNGSYAIRSGVLARLYDTLKMSDADMTITDSSWVVQDWKNTLQNLEELSSLLSRPNDTILQRIQQLRGSLKEAKPSAQMRTVMEIARETLGPPASAPAPAAPAPDSGDDVVF